MAKRDGRDGGASEVRGFRNFEPRTSDHVFLECLVFHAPWSVALADLFSILRVAYVGKVVDTRIVGHTHVVMSGNRR